MIMINSFSHRDKYFIKSVVVLLFDNVDGLYLFQLTDLSVLAGFYLILGHFLLLNMFNQSLYLADFLVVRGHHFHLSIILIIAIIVIVSE